MPVCGIENDSVNVAALLNPSRHIFSIFDTVLRLPEPICKARHPSVPWKAITGAGNIYRHNYEDVSQREVWLTVTRDLPPLLAVIENELSRLG